MSRDIKFRRWHKELKDMIYSGLHISDFFQVIQSYPEMYELMQFTGITDKNGAEIYEGDIVRVDWQDDRYKPVVVEVQWDKETASWSFGAGSTSEVNWSHEVIGNIYENIELLNPTK